MMWLMILTVIAIKVALFGYGYRVMMQAFEVERRAIEGEQR